MYTFFPQMLLAEHVDPNILNEDGATSLHLARDPAIIRVSIGIDSHTSILSAFAMEVLPKRFCLSMDCLLA